jgi:hypothetical protein
MQLNAQSRHIERLPAGQVGDGDLPRTYISIPETRSKRQLGDRIGESGDGWGVLLVPCMRRPVLVN